MADVFLNSANSWQHAFSTLAPPSSYTMKGVKSWQYEILHSSFKWKLRKDKRHFFLKIAPLEWTSVDIDKSPPLYHITINMYLIIINGWICILKNIELSDIQIFLFEVFKKLDVAQDFQNLACTYFYFVYILCCWCLVLRPILQFFFEIFSILRTSNVVLKYLNEKE